MVLLGWQRSGGNQNMCNRTCAASKKVDNQVTERFSLNSLPAGPLFCQEQAFVYRPRIWWLARGPVVPRLKNRSHACRYILAYIFTRHANLKLTLWIYIHSPVSGCSGKFNTAACFCIEIRQEFRPYAVYLIINVPIMAIIAAL